MRDPLATSERSAGTIQSGSGICGKVFIFYRGRGQSTGKGLNQDFQQSMHDRELFLRQHVDQQMNLLALLHAIRVRPCTHKAYCSAQA